MHRARSPRHRTGSLDLVVVLLLLSLPAPAAPGVASSRVATPHPNIVFVLCDDLGYGDVRCLNAGSRIPTPHLDRLAGQGMVFTDAHSSSAVCTPTRYGLLTGRYNWRSRLQSGVQGGMSPPLIEPGRLTVAELLRQAGYRTAVVGKWHLGMEWSLKPGGAPFDDAIEKGTDAWRVDFTQPIRRGPTSVGFDHFFGIAASLDMVPYTFIENERVTALPTMDASFPMFLGRTNGQTRRGPAAPGFTAEGVLPALVSHAVAWLEEQAPEARAGRPFFLYLPLTSPHTPIAPSPAWRGRSGLNAYADFVMETDDGIGQVLRALERHGLATNTMVWFASDNGCSPSADFAQLRSLGHQPSGPLRGMKADAFDGGHRIPLIVRWPGRIAPGQTVRQLVCLNDFMATCADLIHARLPAQAGEDSVSLLPALLDRTKSPVRRTLIHHSINGSFAIREGSWKLLLCGGSGGWSEPKPGSAAEAALPDTQLYDLERDPGETQNLARRHPRVVRRLTRLLEEQIQAGRSTPGPRQTNANTVLVRKTP